MNEFNKAAEGDKSLAKMMADFGTKLANSDNDYNSNGYDELARAGYYLNTVWPLKRNDAEDCWDTAYNLENLANSCQCHMADIADSDFIDALYAKFEEVLREGVERFPTFLKIKGYLADCIIRKNDRNQTDSYDEAVDILLEMIALAGEGDDEEAEYTLWTTYLGSAGKLKLESMEMPQWARAERPDFNGFRYT